MQITKFFMNGLRGTLKLANGTQFSHAGPWVNVIEKIEIDSWYVGDFMSADYTIVADAGTNTKEIIKCLIVASPDNAAITAYGQTDLTGKVIELEASVNNSKLTLYATPVLNPAKVYFSASYYQTINPNLLT
jgi:hypothetical protein